MTASEPSTHARIPAARPSTAPVTLAPQAAELLHTPLAAASRSRVPLAAAVAALAALIALLMRLLGVGRS